MSFILDCRETYGYLKIHSARWAPYIYCRTLLKSWCFQWIPTSNTVTGKILTAGTYVTQPILISAKIFWCTVVFVVLNFLLPHYPRNYILNKLDILISRKLIMVYLQTVLLELNDTSENKHLEILSLAPNYKLANNLEIKRCLMKILTNQNSINKNTFSV